MIGDEFKQNIFAYHYVFAESIIIIHNLLRENRYNEARNTMIFNYLYAYALNGGNYSKELENQLRKMDIFELLCLMVKEQRKADLIPTQKTNTQSFYNRILKGVIDE